MLLTAGIEAMELGWLPDPAIRWGIRRLCAQRLRESGHDTAGFASRMRQGDVAPVPHKANEQHYELPPEFFGYVLGRHRKYSCCLWEPGCATLDGAEEAALRATCDRADLGNGMDILELGCGWGSLSLWMAEHYPGSRITAVSNSAPQRLYIESEARRRGLPNLHVITADMNRFEPPGQYHRVVSVEMFEHMRNYKELLRRIHHWTHPGARLFLHVFCHARIAYEFLPEGEDNWMGKYFFTGGIMPSEDLLPQFQDHFALRQQWRWSGIHYQKTAEAWLANQDRNRDRILPVLERTYGADQAARWFQRWRVFWMSCAELWGYAGGEEWLVAHYLFDRR
ncbi:MAG: class I SAM-dependent methyltransferase [Acidobacteria bacterium]|nr:class I SAM-dependent methyltransferase [Acidobacteriota bacterium]